MNHARNLWLKALPPLLLAAAVSGPARLLAQEITCPSNFVRVPANPAMGTYCDFCVAKYEMKILGKDDGNIPYDPADVAESRASGTPWKNLTMEQAREECEALGPGYTLMSNPEWMTIARNIESVATNWNDNRAHDFSDTAAALCIGHSCRKGALGSSCRADQVSYSGEGLAASTNDAEGCYGYVKGDYEASVPTLNSNGWSLFRRTFFLDNGACIWDFGGNVWEWTTLSVPLAADRPRFNGVVDDEWLEINKPNSNLDVMPSNTFKSSQRTLIPTNMNGNRLGRYHAGSNDFTQGVAMRGGNYMHGAYNNGIYALGMGYSPTSSHIICEIGFRAVYHPISDTQDSDSDGVSDVRESIAGTCPTNAASLPVIQTAGVAGGALIQIPLAPPAGRGAREYARFYTLQTSSNLASGVWSNVPGYSQRPADGETIVYTNCPCQGEAYFRHQVWIETE